MKHKKMKMKKMNSQVTQSVTQSNNQMTNINEDNEKKESELFLKEYLQRRFIKSMMLTYCITNSFTDSLNNE